MQTPSDENLTLHKHCLTLTTSLGGSSGTESSPVPLRDEMLEVGAGSGGIEFLPGTQ